jgi:hypothetical protein
MQAIDYPLSDVSLGREKHAVCTNVHQNEHHSHHKMSYLSKPKCQYKMLNNFKSKFIRSIRITCNCKGALLVMFAHRTLSLAFTVKGSEKYKPIRRPCLPPPRHSPPPPSPNPASLLFSTTWHCPDPFLLKGVSPKFSKYITS